METYIGGGVKGEDDGTRAEGDDADAGLQVVLGLCLDGDLTLRPDRLGADRAPRLDDHRLLQSDLLRGQEAIVLQLICRRMTKKSLKQTTTKNQLICRRMTKKSLKQTSTKIS